MVIQRKTPSGFSISLASELETPLEGWPTMRGSPPAPAPGEQRSVEALSRLAGESAHEFNNLMTVIMGNASLLLAGLQNHEARRDLEAIVAACERGTCFTSSLLLLSARAWRECRTVDLANLLRSMDLGRTLSSEVVLITDLPEERCRVLADPQHLEDAVNALVANARDALPQRGFIRVALNPVPEEGSDGSDTPEWIHLEVADNGIGMDEETAARALEPFFSTKPGSPGAGLGLSSAFGVIRQSGGTMRIESAAGWGTRVHVWLPTAPEVRACAGENR